MPKVLIYITSQCSFCKSAKGFLREYGVPFTEINVESSDEALGELLQKSGQLGVPVIDIDGQIVLGFDRRRLVNLLAIAKS